MILFRKKKQEIQNIKPEPLENLELPTLEDIKKLEEEIKKEIESSKKEIETKENLENKVKKEINLHVDESVEISKPQLPVFVKLEKYQQIVMTLNDINSMIKSLESSLRLFKEIEKMREENLTTMRKELERLKEMLRKLNSIFKVEVRTEISEEREKEIKDLEKLLTDLKTQIESLKSEINP